MATTFDDWLRQLAIARKGPLRLPAATRGLAYSEPVRVAGDWTGATLAGAIRSGPDAAGAPLATFTIAGPVVADGFSTWTLALAAGSGANSTGGLPVDGDLDGVVELPFSLLITPLGLDQQLLVGGVFPVLGKV
jgi:hypothetical protein